MIELPCCVRDASGEVHNVTSFGINIRARVATSEQEIFILQHTAKRDKGPTSLPQLQTVVPGGNNFDLQGPVSSESVAVFDRLQFKTATPQSKRKNVKQHYVIIAELMADVGNSNQIVIGSVESYRLVVRGKSPSHYMDSGSSLANPGGPLLSGPYPPRRFSSSLYERGSVTDLLQSPVTTDPHQGLPAAPIVMPSLGFPSTPHPANFPPVSMSLPSRPPIAISSQADFNRDSSLQGTSLSVETGSSFGSNSNSFSNHSQMQPTTPLSPYSPMVAMGAFPAGHSGYGGMYHPGGYNQTGTNYQNPLFMRTRTHSMVSLADSEASCSSDVSYSSYDFSEPPLSATSVTGPSFGSAFGPGEEPNFSGFNISKDDEQMSSSSPAVGVPPMSLPDVGSTSSPATPPLLQRRPSVQLHLHLPGRRASLANLRPESPHPNSGVPQGMFGIAPLDGEAEGAVSSATVNGQRLGSLALGTNRMGILASPVTTVVSTVNGGMPPIAAPALGSALNVSPMIVPSNILPGSPITIGSSLGRSPAMGPSQIGTISSLGLQDGRMSNDFRRSSLASIHEGAVILNGEDRTPTLTNLATPETYAVQMDVGNGNGRPRRALSETMGTQFMSNLNIGMSSFQPSQQQQQLQQVVSTESQAQGNASPLENGTGISPHLLQGQLTPSLGATPVMPSSLLSGPSDMDSTPTFASVEPPRFANSSARSHFGHDGTDVFVGSPVHNERQLVGVNGASPLSKDLKSDMDDDFVDMSNPLEPLSFGGGGKVDSFDDVVMGGESIFQGLEQFRV
ncbi:meiosis-specific transcription factor ndt80 [Phlyctochytrium planicorne]|nr:meiosis-specific transcription factor ndt80 [Phlyctochytrium planicorne]